MLCAAVYGSLLNLFLYCSNSCFVTGNPNIFNAPTIPSDGYDKSSTVAGSVILPLDFHKSNA